MAANAKVAIASATVSGSPASNVVFSGISQAYTDLILEVSVKLSSGSATNDKINFNGDTTANYSSTILYASGSTVGSYARTSQTFLYVDDVTSTNFSSNTYHIQNYANTSTYKTVLGRYNIIDSTFGENIGVWRSTAAINSLTFTAGASTFVVGSTFTLYGIKGA